jgi:outer membrane protein insertion porin family
MTEIKRIAVYLFFILVFASVLHAQQVKYELKKVQFTGNSYMNSLQLSEICFSKESPGWLAKLINSFSPFGAETSFFDSSLVVLDVKLIQNIYNSKGFWKVKVVPKYTLDAKAGTAELVFHINENKPFHFRNFEISGLERLPSDLQRSLQGNIIVDTSEIYSTQLVKDKKDYIRSFLSNNGYMDVSDPVPDVMLDSVRNKVDVKMNFVTGGRLKISDIKINKVGAGKDLIDDSLIKDIFGIETDTYYSQYENTKAQLRLLRTQLFESLEINHGFVDNVNNTVPLEINGRITSLHELSPEIIANNEGEEFNLGLTLSFIKKNFLGDARKMTITATAATKNLAQVGYTDLRAAFEQPYLFGSQIRPSLETYFTNQLWKDSYDALFYGAKINLDFESELNSYTFVTAFSTYINWEYSKYDMQKEYILKRLSNLDSASIHMLNLGDKTRFSGDNAIIGLVFGHDKTNRLLFPSSGVSASLVIEDGNSFLFLLNKIVNSPFGRPLYLKSVLNISSFYPLWDEKTAVLAVKFKGGSILTYRGDKLDIPINQRLYGGGSNSVRGWQSRELVPSTPAVVIGPNTSKEDLDALLKKVSPGGYLLLEGSFEMRTKLGENFGTAVFLDYGNSWNALKDIAINTVAVSAGLGFRIYTSIIPPIRLDFGFKLYDPFKQKLDVNKSVGDLFKENFEIQFGIGEAF